MEFAEYLNGTDLSPVPPLQGEFKELVPGKRLVMDWRFSSWQDGCLSKVIMGRVPS